MRKLVTEVLLNHWYVPLKSVYTSGSCMMPNVCISLPYVRVSATVPARLPVCPTNTKPRCSELGLLWFHTVFSTSRPPTGTTQALNLHTRHTHLLSSQCSQQACRQSPQQSANQSLLCSLDQTALPSLADSEADSQARGNVLGESCSRLFCCRIRHPVSRAGLFH